MGVIIDCKSNSSRFWNRNDSTLAYFDDIKKYPVLSKEEEKELLYTIKNGDKKESIQARNKLVSHNQRFVASVARKFSNGENLLDLINEANIGLLMAIDKFDLNYDGRFLTYAVFWMRKYINEYLISKEKSVQPINAHKVYAYANKGREMFFHANKRYPSEEELSALIKEKYGISIPNKSDLIQYTINSIDVAYDNDGEMYNGECHGDFAVVTSSNNVNDNIEKEDKKSFVNYLLSKLPDKNKEIVCRYYGIGHEEESMESISKRMGLTLSDIKKSLKKSLKFLNNKNNLKY